MAARRSFSPAIRCQSEPQPRPFFVFGSSCVMHSRVTIGQLALERYHSGMRTIRTEQGAFQATLLDTLPRTLCFMSIAPVAPTTTRS